MKRFFRILKITVLSFIVFIATYALAAYILSRIGVAREGPGGSDVKIFILTNGVHTDIVVPVKTGVIDWSESIMYRYTSSNDTTAQLIAFGWGDKGFYLETPTWSDLKFST